MFDEQTRRMVEVDEEKARANPHLSFKVSEEVRLKDVIFRITAIHDTGMTLTAVRKAGGLADAIEEFTKQVTKK